MYEFALKYYNSEVIKLFLYSLILSISSENSANFGEFNSFESSTPSINDNKYKDIPIIMVTARSQLEDKAIGEETGVNEYITKPFELDQIVKKVEEYLGKDEGEGAAEGEA